MPDVGYTYGYTYIEQITTNLTEVARALGEDDAAQARIKEYEDRIAELKQRVIDAGLTDKPVSVIRLAQFGYSVRIGTSESIAFRALGIAQPKGQQNPDDFSVELSLENLNILNEAHTVFIYVDDNAGAERDIVMQNAVWQGLEPVKAGRVFEVNSGIWNSIDIIGLQRTAADCSGSSTTSRRCSSSPPRLSESQPMPLTPVDAWSPAEGLHAPPVLVGGPGPDDGDRWFRLSDLADLDSGLIDGLIDDVTESRGYRDGQARGGGLALLTAGIGMGAALRTFDGVSVPVLDPATTWVDISEYGNARTVRVEEAQFIAPSILAVRSMLEGALGPLYDALRERTRFPVVAQWAQFTSHLAYMFVESPAVTTGDATAFLDEWCAEGVWARARPRVTDLESDTGPISYVTRRVCCYNFRGRGGHYCSSQCPLVPSEEREQAARDRLAQ